MAKDDFRAAALQTRYDADVKTLRTNWDRHEMLVKDLEALARVKTGKLNFAVAGPEVRPKKPGAPYQEPYLTATIALKQGVKKLASAEITFGLGASYNFAGGKNRANGLGSNAVYTKLREWILELDSGRGMSLTDALEREKNRPAVEKTALYPKSS